MTIEITEVQTRGERQVIGYRCSCGVSSGRWTGEPPKVGDERTVEFDADDELLLGKNARRAEILEPSIRSVGGAVEVTARLVAKHVDEETVTLAFGDGRLEIEVEEVALPDWEVGGWYTILVASLDVYDVNT